MGWVGVGLWGGCGWICRSAGFHHQGIDLIDHLRTPQQTPSLELLQEEVQSRAWLGCCAVGLALLLLSLALALNPSTPPTAPSTSPIAPPPPLPLPSPLAARVCDWLGDSWMTRLGITFETGAGNGDNDPWRPLEPPAQPPVRPEAGGRGQRGQGQGEEEGGSRQQQQRRRRKSKGQQGGMPRGEGPMPPLIV